MSRVAGAGRLAYNRKQAPGLPWSTMLRGAKLSHKEDGKKMSTVRLENGIQRSIYESEQNDKAIAAPTLEPTWY